MSAQTIGVLFVCLGNICRSPAAEGTFAHLVGKRGLAARFEIDSCGTSAYHIGEAANQTSRAVARRHGIELTSRARQFVPADFDRFNYIFAMDHSNASAIRGQARGPEDRERIHLFRAFDPLFSDGQQPGSKKSPPDVPDPYYGGEDGFEEVQQIMLRTSENLLDWLVTRHGLG